MTYRQWTRLAELCGLALNNYLPESDEYWHVRWTQSYARTNALTLQLKGKQKGKHQKTLTELPPPSSLPAMLEHPTQSVAVELLPPPPYLASAMERRSEPTPENQIARSPQPIEPLTEAKPETEPETVEERSAEAEAVAGGGEGPGEGEPGEADETQTSGMA